MSLSAAETSLTSCESTTSYELSSGRNNSSIMLAKIIRPYWVSLREEDSA